MLLVFNVYHSPSVLPATHVLAVDDDGALRPNDSERNHIPDLLIQLYLFVIVLLGIERIQPDVVVNEFSADLENM